MGGGRAHGGVNAARRGGNAPAIAQCAASPAGCRGGAATSNSCPQKKTGLDDTKANRERLRRIAEAVTAEIRAGQFTAECYRHYFPGGNRRDVPPLKNQDAKAPDSECAPTVAEYFAESPSTSPNG